MSDVKFLSEYKQGTRTAQVLKRQEQYSVYCFCCGNEYEHTGFETASSAEDWAEDWVQQQVEIPDLVVSTGCGCH